MRTFVRKVVLAIIIAAAVAIGFWAYPHLRAMPWLDYPRTVAVWASVWSLLAMVSVVSVCQIGIERFGAMVRTRQINGATVCTVFTVIGAIASTVGAWVAVRG